MTRDGDFDALFKALGLDELPDGEVTLDATFVPRSPREQRTGPRKPIQLTVPVSATLPRLELKSPDLAKLTRMKPSYVVEYADSGPSGVSFPRHSSPSPVGDELLERVLGCGVKPSRKAHSLDQLLGCLLEMKGRGPVRRIGRQALHGIEVENRRHRARRQSQPGRPHRA